MRLIDSRTDCARNQTLLDLLRVFVALRDDCFLVDFPGHGTIVYADSLPIQVLNRVD
jgi:hypothetical protein